MSDQNEDLIGHNYVLLTEKNYLQHCHGISRKFNPYYKLTQIMIINTIFAVPVSLDLPPFAHPTFSSWIWTSLTCN